MEQWVIMAQAEIEASYRKILADVAGDFEITIPDDFGRNYMDAAYRAIANYPAIIFGKEPLPEDKEEEPV